MRKQLKNFFLYFLICFVLAVHFFVIPTIRSFLKTNVKLTPIDKCDPESEGYYKFKSECRRENFILVMSSRKGKYVQFNFSSGRRIRHPWSSDADCANFSVRFAEYYSFHPTLLVSFPGSGNTWIRYLIEGATGVFTGSIYEDAELISAGFYGERTNWLDGSTIVQKTHLPAPSMHSKDVPIDQTKVILLIRSPFESIISQHNYLFAGHLGFASVKHFVREDWNTFVLSQLKLWFDTMNEWLLSIPTRNLFVVHYENVKERPISAIKDVANFLEIETNEDRLHCLQVHKKGAFMRHKQYFPDEEIFSAHALSVMKKAISEFNASLKRRGIEGIPFEAYEDNWKKRLIYVCPDHLSRIQCLSDVDDRNNDLSVNVTSNVPRKFFNIQETGMIKSYVKSLIKKEMRRFLESQERAKIDNA